MRISDIPDGNLRPGMLVKSIPTGKKGRIVYLDWENLNKPLGPEVYIEWDEKAKPYPSKDDVMLRGRATDGAISCWWSRLLGTVEVLNG